MAFILNSTALAFMFAGAGIIVACLWFLPTALRIDRFRNLHLADVDNMPGHAFEEYVAHLLRHQGFQATVTPKSGDLGVDVIARQGNLSYAVQCKRYSSTLSRTCVSDAVAGKMHYNCAHAMVVTNNFFTHGARTLAHSTGCVLVDRNTLAAWINAYHAPKVKPAHVSAPTPPPAAPSL